MNFAQAMNDETTKTFTENGAKARNTSNNALVDLFGTIGALRTRSATEIETLFEEAYKQDPLIATKILFYARDIRGGLGERRTFRILIKYLAQYHPEALKSNLDLIGVFGRYDDLYELIGTPLEKDMWATMKAQFSEDLTNLANGNAVSLLAKWIKTPDASSANTRKLGILTAKKLGYSVYDFKRMLRALRKQIDIVERHISAKEYDKITYSAVPSRAMLLYRNLFVKNDTNRFNEFISNALSGKEKINSGVLYPYDIVGKYGLGTYNEIKEDATLEAQWKQLPNYIEENTSALVISDLSGSMYGRPMYTSIGLAIYFAERNKGEYQDMFIPFSSNSHLVKIKGTTLAQKIKYVFNAGNKYCGSTNLESAFKKVLEVAISHNVPKEEMVKSLIVISDMEIDDATDSYYGHSRDNWSFYENMKAMYEDAGYDIPNVVFWNVNSRHDIFHADATRKGVQLVSGQSASTFKNLIGALNYTPVELMMQVINSERYNAITIA